MNEMSNRENTKRSGPSVVARLMGMDTLPPETEPTISVKECSDESFRQLDSRIARCESTKFVSGSLTLTTFKQSDDKLLLNWKKQYSGPSTKGPSSAKPFGREHPQEEQLQKFKKEFEEWQESKLCEFSSSLGQNNSSDELKNEQIFALESLNKEKMAGYTNTYTSVNKLKFTPNQLHGFQNDNNFGKQLMPQTKDNVAIMRDLVDKSIEPESRGKFQEKRSIACLPSRIVILKSFSDMNDEMEGPRGCSPEVFEKSRSIEDFLEEVKERLRLELEGKGRNDSIWRLSATHSSSPLHESLTGSTQLSQEFAKNVKENINADLEPTLGRSESLRSYKNEFHFDGQEFPEPFKKDTRKFKSTKLKKVLKDDSQLEKPMLDDGRGRKFLTSKEKASLKSITAFSKDGKDTSFWEHKKAVSVSIPKHFRNATENKKLQKPEAYKNDSAVVNKSKKDGFNIKGKVSNLRRTLGLKGNFFGKKASSLQESTIDTVHYMKPNQTMPLVARNFGAVQDNSTEVPPSPASFPCSPTSEYHSPVSPLEGPFVEDYPSTQVSGELNIIHRESKIQTEDAEDKLHGVETASELYFSIDEGHGDAFARNILLEDVENKGYGSETASELYDSYDTFLIEDHGEAYVRDILFFSGLYKAWPLDQAASVMDGQIKPISPFIFDEVEENYRKLARSLDGNCSVVNLGDTVIDRKMLFDLVNQALPSIIDAPLTRLMSERRTCSLTPLPIGRKLLAELLPQIQIHVNPKIDQPQSIENIVAWDVKLMPISVTSREDIGSLGTGVERAIFGDLIDELVFDLLI